MAGVDQRTPILILQISMLLLDLSINVAATLLYWHNTVLLMLYVIQDTCTVMSLIIMFLTFFSTYVFQAGLISVLVAQFQATIYSSIVYFAFSIAFHVWSLRERWSRQYEDVLTTGMVSVYVIHRTSAILYYYFYKRTALMLGNPRYHQDSPWLRAQIALKQ